MSEEKPEKMERSAGPRQTSCGSGQEGSKSTGQVVREGLGPQVGAGAGEDGEL